MREDRRQNTRRNEAIDAVLAHLTHALPSLYELRAADFCLNLRDSDRMIPQRANVQGRLFELAVHSRLDLLPGIDFDVRLPDGSPFYVERNGEFHIIQENPHRTIARFDDAFLLDGISFFVEDKSGRAFAHKFHRYVGQAKHVFGNNTAFILCKIRQSDSKKPLVSRLRSEGAYAVHMPYLRSELDDAVTHWMRVLKGEKSVPSRSDTATGDSDDQNYLQVRDRTCW